MEARVFERFAERLSTRPYCINDLNLGKIRVSPANKALERRYIQPNRPNTVPYMASDLDRRGSSIVYQGQTHLGLP